MSRDILNPFGLAKKANRIFPKFSKKGDNVRLIKPFLITDNRVKRTRDEIKHERPCLAEIKSLLNCLGENQFEQRKCATQESFYDECMKRHFEETRDARKLKKAKKNAKGFDPMDNIKVDPVTGRKLYNSEQINKLLARYPQPNLNLGIGKEKYKTGATLKKRTTREY